MKEFVISKKDDGKRLDKWLIAELPLLTMGLREKYIRLKRIKVNGKGAQRDTRLKTGDVLNLYINDEYFEKPKKVIGSNTVDCIKSGLLYGNAGMLDGLIERINDTLGEKCTVVATGGLSTVVAPLCKNEIIIDEDMLLKGLKVIYNKNK